MSPLSIQILLHYHACAGRHWTPPSHAADECIREFIRAGILSTQGTGYTPEILIADRSIPLTLTARGNSLVTAILTAADRDFTCHDIRINGKRQPRELFICNLSDIESYDLEDIDSCTTDAKARAQRSPEDDTYIIIEGSRRASYSKRVVELSKFVEDEQ